MRYLSLFICCLVGCVFFVSSLRAQEIENYRLLIYGDSLSAGYKVSREDSFYEQLQEALISKGYKQVQVLSRSKSGETTSGGLRRLSQALQLKPNAVLLELGINDVFMGRSIDAIYKNLTEIIDTFKENNIAVFLIGMQAPPIAEPIYQKQFSDMYVRLAKENHLMLYPFFMRDLFEIKSGRVVPVSALIKNDNVHPTEEGIALMVKNILPDVISFLKQNGVFPEKR